MAINRIKSWFEENREKCSFDEGDLCKKILANVVGFDLNPLAVMAARTNYLIAVRDLVSHADRVELPVYLCDSIMTPSEYGGLFGGALGKSKELKTAAATFVIPTEIATTSEDVAKYAEQLEFCVRNDYSADDFVARCQDEGLPVQTRKIHSELYEDLLRLNRANKNGVWARIIKNAFAPLFVGKVDYVAGNPPWVNWEHLPDEYRQSTSPIWQRYNLFRHKGYKAKLGGGKDDVSILMTYVAHDSYLSAGGKLGFVITQSVFKTKGGGEGFRAFGYDKDKTKVVLTPLAVHDLSDFQPFEGATNRTAILVVGKTSDQFKYPVGYVVWKKTTKEAIGQDWALDKVLQFTVRKTLFAQPVIAKDKTSPWITASENALLGIQKVIGQSHYRAYAGCCTWMNGVYWVRVISQLGSGNLLIENLYDVGKTKLECVQSQIEAALLYPLLKGKDISRWKAHPSAQIILVNRTDKLAGLSEAEMKRNFPKTFSYLKRFEAQLRKRSGVKQYFKPSDPFYSIYNVGPYTISPWKVAWKRMDTRLQAAVVGSVAKKPILCQETHTFVPVDRADEAHYIAALLNSSPSDFLVRSYSISKGFASAHILQTISIPKFDSKNANHRRLAEVSAKCHSAANEEDRREVLRLERQIDEQAAKLWELTDKEMNEIRTGLQEIGGSPQADDEDDSEV
jgi:hypothetical protein